MRKYLAIILLLLGAALRCGAVQLQADTVFSVAGIRVAGFIPEGRGKTAVLICPGGSYYWLDYDNEGLKVAQWLKEAGIAAFVVKYKVAGVPAFIGRYRRVLRGVRYPDQIAGLAAVISNIRGASDVFGICPSKLGVMGFSAGGHLSLSSAYLTPKTARPDFVAAIYPVVTMSDERYVHRRSRRGLLGEKLQRSPTMRDSLSVEKHVLPSWPPVFLLCCEDDPVVDWHNSFLADSALTEAGVRHDFVLFPSGGHGFGAEPVLQNEFTLTWQGLFLSWLESLKFELL